MNPKTHLRYLMLSLLSAVLFIISWQPVSFIPAIFGAFIPLLYVEKQLREQGKGNGWLFLYSFIAFFVWNIGNTWWLWNATIEGAYAAFVINTLLMCLPLMVYHYIQKRSIASHAEWTFMMAWLSFEYLHHTWEFSWPWLSLGNVFSAVPNMVQWYEYTGIAGGSFWVLYANIKLFRLIHKWKENSSTLNSSRLMNLLFFIGFAPMFLSWYVLDNYKTSGIPMNVAVVQPNVDPYKDKFSGISPIEQTRSMLQLAEQVVDSTTQLVCFPETALLGSLEESRLSSNENILLVKQFLSKHPNLTILSGADTYHFYETEAEKTFTARKYDDGMYYDSYNTALLINASDSIQVYHKSKLVPGVESMPYQQVLGFMGSAAIELGGTAGSLGRNGEAIVFDMGRNQFIAPVICYESVFGEYVTDYVRKGAGLLCVVTNDGWWGNSPGHRQHFDYARLRAIETRRFVARSANTGTSGFIDDKGAVLAETGWWEPAAIKATLSYQKGETFYVKYAHYIGLLPVLLLLLAVFRKRVAG
ncbi:MAG: apolipoprotein N-acyltransferase [Bacteroidota bacterium]